MAPTAELSVPDGLRLRTELRWGVLSSARRPFMHPHPSAGSEGPALPGFRTGEEVQLTVESVRGENLESLVFLNVPLTLTGRPDEPFGACALSLNLRTRVDQLPALPSELRAACHAKFGLVGAKGAYNVQRVNERAAPRRGPGSRSSAVGSGREPVIGCDGRGGRRR